MGTVSTTVTQFHNTGDRIETRGTITLSSSYALAGDTFTARLFGLGTIATLNIHPTNGFFFQDDLTNLKILANTKRPKSANIGQSVTIIGTTATSPLFAGSFAQGEFGQPTLITPVSTMAVANSVPLTSLSGLTMPVQAAVTTAYTGMVALYAHPNNAFLHTTSSVQVGTKFIALSDGSLLPVQTDTSAYWAVTVSTATAKAIITTGSASCTLTISSAAMLSAPNISGGSTSYAEVPSGTDLSSFTARFEATGW